MITYPGAAFLTTATSGATGGVIVTSGATDTHGWWPTPLVAQGNDPRSAAVLMAAVESATDRTNWLGWRAVDWIAGGDWRTLFIPTVKVGNSFVADHSGSSDALAGVSGVGGSANGSGGAFNGGGGNAFGVEAYGHGTAAAVYAVGGSGGIGGRFFAGSGSNANGAEATGDGTGYGFRAIPGAGQSAAILAHNGALVVDQNVSSTSAATGTNHLYATNIAKAWGYGETNGLGGFTANSGGINWSATISPTTQINVTFTTAMADAFYDVSVTVSDSSGTIYATGILINSQSSFSFTAAAVIPGASSGTLVHFGGLGTWLFSFRVFARQ